MAAGDEETKTEFGCGGIDACVELDEGLVEEAVEGGGLSGPVVFEVFSGLVFSGEL